jgi:hypothetical protein
MSLLKGRAAAQPSSSSSFKPCGVPSGFSVTTQVLLRSVVESSHCPIIDFFSAPTSCAASGDAAKTIIAAANRPPQVCRKKIRTPNIVNVP